MRDLFVNVILPFWGAFALVIFIVGVPVVAVLGIVELVRWWRRR